MIVAFKWFVVALLFYFGSQLLMFGIVIVTHFKLFKGPVHHQ